MKPGTKILVVDDETVVRESLRDWLTEAGYEVFTAEDGFKALDIINRERTSIVIADLVMPGMDGIELIKKAKEIIPYIGVIIITAYGSIPTAIAAIREEAYDYIEKPFCPERVEMLIKNLVERQELVKENISLRQRLADRYSFENIIAKSHKMRQIFEMVEIVARSNATVLIVGESGTGKELIARAIHNLSPRRHKPFIAISCGALPETLLESELFGHEKGSFTGAIAQRKGKFEIAHQGTLFLDEIGEMSHNIQVHLLRVLEEKEFTRVGGNEPIKVDVRIISATHRDLKKAVERGEFREDLFYRLNVVTLNLPPLRDRREDIPLLAEHFLRKFAVENQREIKGFSPEAMDFLLQYDWPGNVRELENMVERAVILSKGDIIGIECLNEQKPAALNVDNKSLKEVEKAHIIQVLKQTKGNFSQAAKVLGVTRMTLYNKLKAHSINVKELDNK